MRILYVDIDSLRPDHLGCYGYGRPTSPHIDRLAEDGAILTNYYASDVPCLPSRTALCTGQFGMRNGVVGHGGTAAQPFVEGAGRGFASALSRHSWLAPLRRAGHRTASVSTFAERHSAWHWYAGFQEVYNHGTRGQELACDVIPYAARWLERHGREEHWFLHVNLWDPHTPYRTPMEYGHPFAEYPPPTWLTEERIAAQRASYGPHGAREPWGFGDGGPSARWPRMVDEIRSTRDFKHWIDGYDTGIRYADDHVGQLLQILADLNVMDETWVLVSADHGENQGELGVYGDHQTADHITARVPLVVSGPGVAPGTVVSGMHYHLDLAPTLCELAGARAPQEWQGRSFATALLGGGAEGGRPALILSQGAWACQRSVRWDRWLLVETYEAGMKPYPPLMLFDIERDPHETEDVVVQHPDVVHRGLAQLHRWHVEQWIASPAGIDPMSTVMREGGPYQTRGAMEAYCARLQATGRGALVDDLRSHGTGSSGQAES